MGEGSAPNTTALADTCRGPLLSTVRAWPHWTALSSASGGVGCSPAVCTQGEEEAFEPQESG